MIPRDSASPRFAAARIAAIVVGVSLAVPLTAATIELGPPARAVLSREKLSSIDDFINAEISAGKILNAYDGDYLFELLPNLVQLLFILIDDERNARKLGILGGSNG